MRDPEIQNRERPGQEPNISSTLAENIRYGAKTYRIGLILGQCFAGIAFLGGFVLALFGLSGHIEWIVQAGGLKSRLANASPGAVFAVIGFLVMWRYKPNITDKLHSTRYSSSVEDKKTPKKDQIHYTSHR